MTKIYMVEFNRFYYFDCSDQEAVEDRYTIGYFTSIELANNAIERCIKETGYMRDEFNVIEYDVKCGRNQKYLYVLNYEFSIKNKKGDYEDFYYKFEPCSNKNKCIDMKLELIHNNKIKIKNNAIYDVSIDGFYIDKIKINFINVVYL